jgi:hypothetical protein
VAAADMVAPQTDSTPTKLPWYCGDIARLKVESKFIAGACGFSSVPSARQACITRVRFSFPIASAGPTGPAMRDETNVWSSGSTYVPPQWFPGSSVSDQKSSLNGSSPIDQ